MSDANKALTRQFLQRISAGDLAAVDELHILDPSSHTSGAPGASGETCIRENG